MQRPLVIPFQGKVVGRCGCACLRLLLAKDGAKRTRAKRGREIGCSFARRHPPALARDPLPAEGGEAMQRPLVIPFQGKVVGRCGCACLRLLLAKDQRSERVRSAGGRSAVPSPDGIPPRLRATPFLRKGVRRCRARLSSPFKERWWGDAGALVFAFCSRRTSEANACEAREGDQLFLRQTASPRACARPPSCGRGEAMQRPLVIPFQGKVM